MTSGPRLPQVVLSGAGISIDSPACLPSPWRLMEAVWTAIRINEKRLLTDALSAQVFERLGERDYSVRMEQFLDALSGPDAIPSLVLSEVYKLVASDTPNDSHRRLAALPAKQFTVNMDTLLEQAGAVGTRHLHGRWDRPRSIKTTVEHYAHGLVPSVRREFARAIEGKRLLVIGYSGQDIDVMPVIEQHPPSNITWVSPRALSLELEATALQLHRRERGLEFDPVPLTADEYLAPLVPVVPEAPPHPSTVQPVDLPVIFGRHTTHHQRVLGIAQLLITIGMGDVALDILADEQFKSHRRTELIARSLSQLDRPQEALAVLQQQQGLLARWEHAGSVAVVARRAKNVPAERAAKRVLAVKLLLPGNRRLRRLRRVQQAKRMAVSGDVVRAARILKRVTGPANASRVLSPSNLVDALTWHSDAVKDGGDLREARRIIGRAEQLSPYGDESQRAYAHWKRTEIDALSGTVPPEVVVDGFSRAIHFATRSGDRDTLAWIRGTCIEYQARHNHTHAREQEARALHEGAHLDDRAGHGPAYFALQRAILAAATREFDHAEARLNEALTLAEQRKAPTLLLQAQQFALYLRWLDGERQSLRSDLLRIAKEARRRNLPLVEARARASADHVIGRGPSHKVIRAARAAKWDMDDITARMKDGVEPAGFYILI